jgi:hypothetical protein
MALGPTEPLTEMSTRHLKKKQTWGFFIVEKNSKCKNGLGNTHPINMLLYHSDKGLKG